MWFLNKLQRSSTENMSDRSKDRDRSKKPKFEWDYIGSKPSKSYSIADALKMSTYKTKNYPFLKMALEASPSESTNLHSRKTSTSLFSLTDSNRDVSSTQEYMKLFSCITKQGNKLPKSAHSSKTSLTTTTYSTQKPRSKQSKRLHNVAAGAVKQKERSEIKKQHGSKDTPTKIASYKRPPKPELTVEKGNEDAKPREVKHKPRKSSSSNIEKRRDSTIQNTESSHDSTIKNTESNQPLDSSIKTLVASNIEKPVENPAVLNVKKSSDLNLDKLFLDIETPVRSSFAELRSSTILSLVSEKSESDSILAVNLDVVTNATYSEATTNVLPSASESETGADIAPLKTEVGPCEIAVKITDPKVFGISLLPRESPSPPSEAYDAGKCTAKASCTDVETSLDTNAKMSSTTITDPTVNLQNVSKSPSKSSLPNEPTQHEEVLKTVSKVSVAKTISEKELNSEKTYLVSSCSKRTSSKIECAPGVPKYMPSICRPVEPTPIKRLFPPTATHKPEIDVESQKIKQQSSQIPKRSATPTKFVSRVAKCSSEGRTLGVNSQISQSKPKLIKKHVCSNMMTAVEKISPKTTKIPYIRRPPTPESPKITRPTTPSAKSKHMIPKCKSGKISAIVKYSTSSKLPIPITSSKAETKPTSPNVTKTFYNKNERPKSAGPQFHAMSVKDKYIVSARKTSSVKTNNVKKCIPVRISQEKCDKVNLPQEASIPVTKSSQQKTTSKSSLHHLEPSKKSKSLNNLMKGKPKHPKLSKGKQRVCLSKISKKSKKRKLYLLVSPKKITYNKFKKPKPKKTLRVDLITTSSTKVVFTNQNLKLTQSSADLSSGNKESVTVVEKTSMKSLAEEPTINKVFVCSSPSLVKSCYSIKSSELEKPMSEPKEVEEQSSSLLTEEAKEDEDPVEEQSGTPLKVEPKKDEDPVEKQSSTPLKVETLRKFSNLTITKVENATFSIDPSPAEVVIKDTKCELPCICKKIMPKTNIEVRRYSSKRLTTKDNILIDLLKPHMEEYLKAPKKTVSSVINLPKTDVEARKTRSNECSLSSSSSRTWNDAALEKLKLSETSTQLQSKSKPTITQAPQEQVPCEGGKSVKELPGQIETIRSKHNACLRKSKLRKAAKDIDPTDIIRQIKTIRMKLAEASKSNSCLKCKQTLIRYKNIFSTSSFGIFHLGEKGSGIRSRGEVQDFYDLRDEHLASGELFEDPEFPADDSSLFFSRRPDRHYEWLRPSEIVDDPQLFVEGYSRFDVQQGELGDCWLLAAVANLTLYRRLFFQIVPDDQGFDEKYAGIFHFRFWQYGRWIDVVIDDRLPTYRGQLIFLHSTEENEFWSALLEKAYAKLHGSYEALKGGSTCEAMEDFTGGVTEMYEMNATPPNLFKIVLKAYERGSLMGASLEPDPEVLEAKTQDGLIRGHAYSITRVRYVDIQTPNTVGKIPLLRLRNPWGNEDEWTGPWSDQSPEWRFIPEHEKENLGLTFDIDGEFWMSFKDFQTHFDRLEICNLTPDSLTEEELTEGHKKQWEMSVFEGEWVRGVTAGGCRNYLDSFWHNPQYRITLTDVDEDDDESKCTVIIALMQKNRRSRRLMGVEFLTVGFAIYYLPDPHRAPKPLDLNYFKYNSSVARSPSFINLREVSCRFRLPPGTYCIVPSTFEPNEEGEFLLRVFSENKNNMEENDEEVGLGEMDNNVAQVTKQVPSAEENEETDKVKEFFLKLAGEDLEVDWKELKDILDYAMRNELQVNKASVRGVEAGVGGRTDSNTDNNSFFDALLGLICARFCKDTPLADIVPNPESASNVEFAPTSSSYETNKGFSKDVCRSMVAMLDTDRSGKLGYEEFKNLWLDIRNWKLVFKMYDKDNSGALSGFELRQALNSAGYQINNHILNILMHRYGNKASELQFDDFILCAVKLKTMIEMFKQKDPDNINKATFSLEDWIETTLYC